MGKIRVEEVAIRVGSSVKTINCWYAWKKTHETSEYAKMLPDFTVEGTHHARYWDEEDVDKIIAFKNIIPKGRNGFLGEVTQGYFHRKQAKKGNGELLSDGEISPNFEALYEQNKKRLEKQYCVGSYHGPLKELLSKVIKEVFIDACWREHEMETA